MGVLRAAQPEPGCRPKPQPNMSYMFEYAKSFNQPIGSWDTSAVVDMSSSNYVLSFLVAVAGLILGNSWMTCTRLRAKDEPGQKTRIKSSSHLSLQWLGPLCFLLCIMPVQAFSLDTNTLWSEFCWEPVKSFSGLTHLPIQAYMIPGWVFLGYLYMMIQMWHCYQWAFPAAIRTVLLSCFRDDMPVANELRPAANPFHRMPLKACDEFFHEQVNQIHLHKTWFSRMVASILRPFRCKRNRATRKVGMTAARKVQGRRYKQKRTVKSRKHLRSTKCKQWALFPNVHAWSRILHSWGCQLWQYIASAYHSPYRCGNARPVGLNTMLRGGGGAGGSQATARKRNEKVEEELLTGLKQLLAQFGPTTPEAPTNKTKGFNPKAKPKPDPPKRQGGTQGNGNNTQAEEGKLLHALQKVVTRAQKQPGTLLTRLASLVDAASKGKLAKAKPETERKPQPTHVREPGQRGKGKGDGATSPQTYADVVRGAKNNPKGKGKGKNKGTSSPKTFQTFNQSAETKPPAKTPKLQNDTMLHKHAFSKICSFAEAKSAVEKGSVPDGEVILCPSLPAMQDLQRLAVLHELLEHKVALLVRPVPDKRLPLGCEEQFLPTWEHGKAGIKKFWVSALGNGLPTLPVQQVAKTSVEIESQPLVAFRATFVKSLCSKDSWEMHKRNPVSAVRNMFDAGLIHSSYGWRELQLESPNGHADIFLQGFVRTKRQHSSFVSKHKGFNGMFFDKIGGERPAVAWVQKQEGESVAEYWERAKTKANSQKGELTFRKGGGSYLGVRVPPGQHVSQIRAWTLRGTPVTWDTKDVLQCLDEADCKHVEILRPPGKQRQWLIKAIVPDIHNLGVVAIQAGSRTLTLQRVESRVKRSVEVLSVIRSTSRRDDNAAAAHTHTNTYNKRTKRVNKKGNVVLGAEPKMRLLPRPKQHRPRNLTLKP